MCTNRDCKHRVRLLLLPQLQTAPVVVSSQAFLLSFGRSTDWITNTAYHPRMPPGPVIQPAYVIVPQRRRRFKLPPLTTSKKNSLKFAGMMFGGFLLFTLVASVILIGGSFILSLFAH